MVTILNMNACTNLFKRLRSMRTSPILTLELEEDKRETLSRLFALGCHLVASSVRIAWWERLGWKLGPFQEEAWSFSTSKGCCSGCVELKYPWANGHPLKPSWMPYASILLKTGKAQRVNPTCERFVSCSPPSKNLFYALIQKTWSEMAIPEPRYAELWQSMEVLRRRTCGVLVHFCFSGHQQRCWSSWNLMKWVCAATVGSSEKNHLNTRTRKTGLPWWCYPHLGIKWLGNLFWAPFVQDWPSHNFPQGEVAEIPEPPAKL